MYWPLGAPKVFAAPGRRKPEEESSADSDDDKDDTDSTADGEDAEAEQTKQRRKLKKAVLEPPAPIIGLRVSRNGQLFATLTETSLSVWQTSPVALLTTVERSRSSLASYGPNAALHLRPDGSVAAIQTAAGYLVTYNISVDPSSRVYQFVRTDDRSRRLSSGEKVAAERQRVGLPEVYIRFRMVVKIEGGLSAALALDDDLVVATEKPAAVQVFRWEPEKDSKDGGGETAPGAKSGGSSQTTTELLHRLKWMHGKAAISELVHNRAMNLFVWIAANGCAYAVQKIDSVSSSKATPAENQGKHFRGHGFHTPKDEKSHAKKAAVNARFSLLAVGTADANIRVYSARDYMGKIPHSHTLVPPASFSTTGSVTFLAFSPDGYCLFAGFERGWVAWSVYGKLIGSSFSADADTAKASGDSWLLCTGDGDWINTGAHLLFYSPGDSRLWALEFARNAVTGCFTPANVAGLLLYTPTMLMLYQGQESADVDSPAVDAASWHHVRIPEGFIFRQGPIRSAVVSSDGRYIAVAGRRGLAHYSVHSGRWKTFDEDVDAENSFIVRGGMCWHQHILIVAADAGEHDEIRLYSREKPLNSSSVVFTERLDSPAVTISPSGDDSLLVYTYENSLHHYVLNASSGSLQLIRVGQIGLHGIVRAPARVRAVTWYIPEHQLLDMDPTQDVMNATVIFLVDAKLVLLQPARDNKGAVRYEMRIVAADVEFFSFTRDHQLAKSGGPELSDGAAPGSVGGRGRADTAGPVSPRMQPQDEGRRPSQGPSLNLRAVGLTDSLWYFDGRTVKCWTDVQELLLLDGADTPRELPAPIGVPVDYYPTTVSLTKGVVIGLESDLFQRKDMKLAYFRLAIRSQLFLPPVLRHLLATNESSAALGLSYHYQSLPYFPHALELLLHDVLDDEVDSKPPPAKSLLPSVVSFLSSFSHYLDVVVRCTRKTEARSWRTLFASLPPARHLFEQSIKVGKLKTAGGYLLVLHTLEEQQKRGSVGSADELYPDDDGSDHSSQAVRLMAKAKRAGEWELCKELARFLVALDPSGKALRKAKQRLELDEDDGDESYDDEDVNGGVSSPVIAGLDDTKVPIIDMQAADSSRSAAGIGSTSFAQSPENSSYAPSHDESPAEER